MIQKYNILKNGINKLSDIRLLAFIGVVFVFYLILSTLNQGISCDEGFYLLGYLDRQKLGDAISDFHFIIKSDIFFIPDNNVLSFRYFRLIFNSLSLMFFAFISYKWLKHRFGLRKNIFLYFCMIILGGFMSFTYAAPTISFDHLQQIFYLLATSVLLLILTYKNKILKSINALFLGFFYVFLLTNYLPSGILFIITSFLLILLEDRNNKFIFFLFSCIGFFLGLLFYHFYIHNLIEYLQSIIRILNIEKSGIANHDNSSLISELIIQIGFLLLISIVYVTFLFFILRKFQLPHILKLILFIIVCATLLIIRDVYLLKSNLFILPIISLFSIYLVQDNEKLKSKILNNDFILFTIFMLLPFIGIFGTNQSLFTKMLIFFPFWIVAYFIIDAKILKQYEFVQNKILYLFVVMLIAGYVYLGNFSRYQYYYSPRSSKFKIENNERYNSILVSKYQKDYYNDLYKILKENGLKKNDTFVAFGENQIPIYMFGGYFYGGLVYHWHQYRAIPKYKPSFIIMFKDEEKDAMKYLKKTRWNFPDDFKKVEMRSMSENMKGMKYNTLIFCKK